MNKFKTTSAILMGVGTFLAISSDVITALQLFPLLLYFVLFTLDYTGKKVFIWMIALSAYMLIANVSLAIYDPWAFLDVALWFFVFLSYLLSNES